MTSEAIRVFQVQESMCATCIYRSDSRLDLHKLESEVKDDYGFDGFRSCHHANDNSICCRGFWDRHKDKFQLGQLAQRLGFVDFVVVDEGGSNDIL